jgi:hypothetical protein
LRLRGKPWSIDEELRLLQLIEEGSFEKIRVDYTREGPSIIADMTTAGIDNAEGVNFSVLAKARWLA